MAEDMGLLLRGLGAAFSNQVPEFRQQMAMERENQYIQSQREQQAQMQRAEMMQARQRAMYQDAESALKLLAAGDLDSVVQLGRERIELLKNFPDADPSDTVRITQLAQLSRAGDRGAYQSLQRELLGAVQRGMSMGYITPPQAEEKVYRPGDVVYRDGQRAFAIPEQQPEQERGVVVNGNVVDPITGRVIYESPASALPSDEFSPGITRYRNGVAVQYSRQGNVRVVDEQGKQVTGAEAQDAIRRGQESGITEAGQVAASQAQSRGATERAQGIINAGVEAIAEFPTLINAISLLDEVKTGGISGASIRARSLFGIESGDEGELSYLLATNVLQKLKRIFGAAFTASEGERLERISPSIGRNPDTNMRLLRDALRISRTAAEKALDRAQEAGDSATAREIERALTQLDEFESSGVNPATPSSVNSDLINRADAIISRGVNNG